MVYDLAVIGGGSAGCKAAEAAATTGRSVALIEKSEIGGNAFKAGVMPLTMLLRALPTLDFWDKSFRQFQLTRASNHVFSRIDVIRKQQTALLKKLAVHVLHAPAVFDSRTADGTFKIIASDESILAKNVVLATGSLPAIAHLPGAVNAIDEGTLLTGGSPLLHNAPPQSILLVGISTAALQWAALLTAAGCKVTLLDRQYSFMRTFHNETCERIVRHLADVGAKFIVPGEITDIGIGHVTVELPSGTRKLEFERILFCGQRLPVTRGMALGKIELKRRDGAVLTDFSACSNVSGVYAAGDCNGRVFTAQAAYREAEVAAAHMHGDKRIQIKYNAIPYFFEALGEAASVGYTDSHAQDKRIHVHGEALPLPYASRYSYDGQGYVRIMKNSQTGRIIGAHIMGEGACHAVRMLSTAIEAGMDSQTTRRYITPDNLATETVRSVLLQLTK
jgi:pyruvate/2-oxoglutarate dehydrogenase complex dihydrolipoamide dehydrogenase (E3) component